MSEPRALGLLSVTAPVLDEEDVLEVFHQRVASALEGIDFELVLVDDGSTDRTPELLAELAERDERVRVVHLSRNFGYQAAVAAGNLDVAITIRTILWDKRRVSIQTGAGIVADSDPASEYQETENKAAAMKETIRLAESGQLFWDRS